MPLVRVQFSSRALARGQPTLMRRAIPRCWRTTLLKDLCLSYSGTCISVSAICICTWAFTVPARDTQRTFLQYRTYCNPSGRSPSSSIPSTRRRSQTARICVALLSSGPIRSVGSALQEH